MISRDEIKRLLQDPREFIPILSIIDERGCPRLFNEPFSEQKEILDALISNRVVYIVKPRQVGSSTIVRAYNFWYGYTCKDPIKELVVAHETEATQKMHRLNTEYLNGLMRLDPAFKRKIRAANRNELWFDPDSDSGVMFRCLTAGSPGAGKSWTFQRAHFTEVGSWPADKAKALWGSLTSTMHEGPHYQLIVESTGHGPRTFWHTKVKEASYAKDGTKVVFLPWYNHRNYSIKAPDGFKSELNEDEEALLRKPIFVNGRESRISLNQVYWRRLKIASMGLTEFRRQYPATIEDPFMDDGGTYFSADVLNAMLLAIDKVKPLYEKNHLRVYKNPEPNKRYILTVDSSSGIGLDFAAIQVFSEDYEQVAVYHHNRIRPEDLASAACEIGLAYGKARIMAENKGQQGGVTLYRIKELRYPNLWKDEKGKDWGMDFVSKSVAYSHARRLINTGGVELNDEMTIRELLRMEIGAPDAPTVQADMISAPKGEHDDLADTAVMALWGLRSMTSHRLWSPAQDFVWRQGMKRLAATPY